VCIERPGPYDCDCGEPDDLDVTDEGFPMDDATHDVGQHRMAFGWKERLERVTDAQFFSHAVMLAIGFTLGVLCYYAYWSFRILSESKY
jgi:hypothetical protein